MKISFSFFSGLPSSKIPKRADLAPNKGGPFAAALRTLAKNAGPEAKDGESLTAVYIASTLRDWGIVEY